jgi:transketolase
MTTSLLQRLTGDEKNAPSAHSTLDVLWVLYDRILRITPATVDAPDRDRFLLSKGHGPAAYYAVLAAKGFIPPTGSTIWPGRRASSATTRTAC